MAHALTQVATSAADLTGATVDETLAALCVHAEVGLTPAWQFLWERRGALSSDRPRNMAICTGDKGCPAIQNVF